LKTIELIVEKTAWTPPPPRYAASTVIALQIETADRNMRARAKAAGARWNPDKKPWYVKYGEIAGTPLEKQLYVDAKR